MPVTLLPQAVTTKNAASYCQMSLPTPRRAKLSSFENHCHNCGTWQQAFIPPPSIFRFSGGVGGGGVIGDAGENSFCPQEESNPPPPEPCSHHCRQERVLESEAQKALCLRTRLHARHLQDVKAALEGAARGWPGSRTSSWLGTLLPLITFLGAKLPIYFLGEIKINAGFCNPIPNPIWKNRSHGAWLPKL